MPDCSVWLTQTLANRKAAFEWIGLNPGQNTNQTRIKRRQNTNKGMAQAAPSPI